MALIPCGGTWEAQWGLGPHFISSPSSPRAVAFCYGSLPASRYSIYHKEKNLASSSPSLFGQFSSSFLFNSGPSQNLRHPRERFVVRADKESPWKSLEKAMGSFGKERSLQDVLREQMKEQELTGGGGGSRNPPGGGDGGGDSSGDSEDAGFSRIIDEIVQVVLATLGFIFVYIYMIRGEELFRLVKDYIKYLFGSKASVRLRRAMYVWGRFYKRITTRKVVDRYWLERAILTTPTWWENPRLLAHRMSPDED